MSRGRQPLFRLSLLKELYLNLIGPKSGPWEIVKDNPLNLYVSGVLSPLKSKVEAKRAEVPPESEEDMIGAIEEGDPISEEDEDFLLSTTGPIDPRRRPSSMGLSFLVQGKGLMDVLVTWARYFKGDGGWHRRPRYALLKLDPSSGRSTFYLGPGGLVRKEEAELSLKVVVKKRETGFHFTIYLVNQLKSTKGPESYIFQPQIRINLREGSLVSKMTSFPKIDKEELILDKIFSNRRPLAKGHMCSAVWKEVDLESMVKDPFTWQDREMVGDLAKDFINPTLRTEFMPAILLEAPEYEWDQKFSPEPELTAHVLAETWNPEELIKKLRPLVDNYEKWIESTFNSDELGELSDIKGYHIQFLNRMKKALEILRDDDDVRLAFCFANKAIDLQTAWKKGKEGDLPIGDFKWRPFQLAFFLLALESISDPNSPSREVCDVLFVPTGGGKTEAYLAIVAFTLALRRRRALKLGKSGAGVAAVLRYTLRLLTIQQFRRALRVITAMEYLRVWGLGRDPVGWRPEGYPGKEDFIWGSTKFSLGLWVGGHVSPNRISSKNYKEDDAIRILEGRRKGAKGEPAQVLNCPVCGSITALPQTGLDSGEHRIFLTIRLEEGSEELVDNTLNYIKSWKYKGGVEAYVEEVHRLPSEGTFSVELVINSDSPISLDTFTKVYNSLKKRFNARRSSKRLSASLVPLNASRPGYFPVRNKPNDWKVTDFVILCPNPKCSLNRAYWIEGAPSGGKEKVRLDRELRPPEKGFVFKEPPDYMSKGGISWRIPIPALTVDEQIYKDPPSFLVGTVDKIARLSYEPRSAAIFGNVNRYSPYWGYYREDVPVESLSELFPRGHEFSVEVEPFDPPELIIQDELHLINGPLGSMVGIFETAVDYLSSREKIPKYIASSATVRSSDDQVRAIFVREARKFPYYGKDFSDRFFIRFRRRGLLEMGSGKLYVGILTPGIGSQFAIRKIWASLLQTAYELSLIYGKEVDPYWTLVAYFNTIKELAISRSVLRQHVREELEFLAGGGEGVRKIDFSRVEELSSKVESTELPAKLNTIKREFSGDPENPGCVDVLLTTSMFGTGVDVRRLSLMFVHGQPKTSSAYLQATGRVGRSFPGLVITYFKFSRPRDLSHYEMFLGYHLNLERYVEPSTATPFAPTTMSRCVGPVAVAILRNDLKVKCSWINNEDAINVISCPRASSDLDNVINVLANRYRRQPQVLRSEDDTSVLAKIREELERWEKVARTVISVGRELVFNEYFQTKYDVVLGDVMHERANRVVVYRNSPNSLRDVEEFTLFEVG